MMAAHSARLIATEIIATGLLYRFIHASLASRASSCVVVCTSNKAGARTRRSTMGSGTSRRRRLGKVNGEAP